MGAAQATITKDTMEAFTKSINSVAVDITNRNSTTDDIKENIKFTFGEPPCKYMFVAEDTTFNFDQTGTSKISFTSENFNRTNANVSSQLANVVKSFITNDLKNKQGFFSTAFGLQITNAMNAEEVSNIIENETKIRSMNICNPENSQIQNLMVSMCGQYTDDSFNVNQDAYTSAVVSCINRNVIDIFTTNKTLNDLYTQTNNKLLSQQKGLGSLFNWIIIIVAAVVILGIIGLIFYYILGGTNKTTSNTKTIPTSNEGVSETVNTKNLEANAAVE